MSAASYETRVDADPMLTRENLAPQAADYLGGADPATPLASPLHADLAGLPPLLVQVGDAEVLLDEVRWDSGTTSGAGRALVVGASGQRCAATTPYGPAVGGSYNAGTPGEPNDACP